MTDDKHVVEHGMYHDAAANGLACSLCDAASNNHGNRVMCDVAIPDADALCGVSGRNRLA